MWGQMLIVVFHSFAYTCCTASFQLFYGMSTIRYKVLNDRAFPQVCYRTLVEYKGSGFLGISVVCVVVFVSKRVLNSRKLVIELGNFCFCLKMGDSDKIGKTLLGESVILQTYNLGDSVKIIIFALENKIVYDLQEKTL